MGCVVKEELEPRKLLKNCISKTIYYLIKNNLCKSIWVINCSGALISN